MNHDRRGHPDAHPCPSASPRSPARPPAYVYLLPCFCLILLGYLLSSVLRPLSPYDNLRTFAEQESVGRVVRDITELPVDELSLYAQATCARASTSERVRAALRAQLRHVPAEARDDILAGAVVDGASTINSVQNTTAGVERDGVAYHYISFWATDFRPATPVSAQTYATCVSTAGVRVAVAEEIAAWRTAKRQRNMGTRPCHCGYLMCERCPVFVEDVTRTPVFKRHKLRLQQQVDLHNWMVLQAVGRARSLSESQTGGLPAWLRKVGWSGWEAVVPRLEAPGFDTFLGEDHGGPVVTGDLGDVQIDTSRDRKEKGEL